MKKCVSLLLAFMLALSFCGASVYAGSEETKAPQDLTGGVVTGFDYERSFRFFENQVSSYNKDNLSELYKILTGIEDVLDCRVLLPGGEETEAMCTAAWNTDELTLDKAGIYSVVATLAAPVGCTFGQGVRTKIVMKVQIIDEEAPIKIVSVEEWNPYLIAVAVERGSTVEDVAAEDIFVDYTTEAISSVDENGGKHLLDINWDFSSINLNKAGAYTITGTIVPPKGTEFAPDITMPVPTATVSVQEKGNPDINCFFVWFPSVYLPWVSTPESAETATVWMSENEGEWQQLIPDEQMVVNQYNVCIALDMFTTGNEYRLQVDYEGGQTGILSLYWDDTIIIEGYQEGDRDGGDSDGNEPPDISQPPPKPDHGGGENGAGDTEGSEEKPAPTPMPTPTPTPNPEPAPSEEGTEHNNGNSFVPAQKEENSTTSTDTNTPTGKTDKPAFVEQTSETATTISGRRLRMMQKNGSVAFSKQGVNVVLSEEAIDALSIADDSVFTIEIKRESENTFSFAVSVDGVKITRLAGTKVTLPYTPSGKEPTLSVRHSKLKTEVPGSYDPKPGLASFVVDTTGQYTILEEAVPAAATPGGSEQPEQPKQAEFPILPICLASGVLLLFCLGVFLLKRRSAK